MSTKILGENFCGFKTYFRLRGGDHQGYSSLTYMKATTESWPPAMPRSVGGGGFRVI